MSRYFIVSTFFLVVFIVSLSVDGIVDVPRAWYISLVILYFVVTTIGSMVLSLQYFVQVKFKGDRKQPAIAITFDDGPVEGKTEKILDILCKHQVQATFFCIGNRVDENPALARRIFDEGHLLGNHSYWHGATFDLQYSGAVIKELTDTDNAIFNAVGKRPKFFRPPYGVTNPMVAKAITRKNYTVIGWRVRSFDTVIKNPDRLFARVTKSLKHGDIVLFHDHAEQTTEILPAFLEHTAKLGLKIVRVDELINEKAYV